MMTQADTVSAVGTPPDRVETPAPGGAFGDTSTHAEMSVPPNGIRENDIYRAGEGDFRTVSQVIELGMTGETALYFRTPHDGLGFRVVLPLGAPDVTVYRPREVARGD